MKKLFLSAAAAVIGIAAAAFQPTLVFADDMSKTAATRWNGDKMMKDDGDFFRDIIFPGGKTSLTCAMVLLFPEVRGLAGHLLGAATRAGAIDGRYAGGDRSLGGRAQEVIVVSRNFSWWVLFTTSDKNPRLPALL